MNVIASVGVVGVVVLCWLLYRFQFLSFRNGKYFFYC